SGRIVRATAEAAAAIAEQNRDVSGTLIGDNKVEIAVLIEIGRRYRLRSGANRVRRRRAKGTVAIAELDRHHARGVFRDSDVGLAVVIEVRKRNVVGAGPERQCGSSREPGT